MNSLWDFFGTGRYAHYGWMIGTIVVIAIACGLSASRSAIMPARTRFGPIGKANMFAIALLVGVWCVHLGSSEPVVSGRSLNIGIALCMLAFSLVVAGAALVFRRSHVGVAIPLFSLSAGAIFGTTVGWVWRSLGPSKYDQPLSGQSALPDNPYHAGGWEPAVCVRCGSTAVVAARTADGDRSAL